MPALARRVRWAGHAQHHQARPLPPPSGVDSLIDALEAADDALDELELLEAAWEHNERLLAAEDAAFVAQLDAEHWALLDEVAARRTRRILALDDDECQAPGIRADS